MGRPRRPASPEREQALPPPGLGDLHLTFGALELPGEPGLTLTAYSAEPGTASGDSLALLASWAATKLQTDPSEAEPHPNPTEG